MLDLHHQFVCHFCSEGLQVVTHFRDVDNLKKKIQIPFAIERNERGKLVRFSPNPSNPREWIESYSVVHSALCILRVHRIFAPISLGVQIKLLYYLEYSYKWF